MLLFVAIVLVPYSGVYQACHVMSVGLALGSEVAIEFVGNAVETDQRSFIRPALRGTVPSFS